MEKQLEQLSRAIEKGDILPTDTGLLLPEFNVKASGLFFDRVNSGEFSFNGNRVVDEGISHLLNVALGSTAKVSYYLALFSGSTAPAANWTAANFASVAAEIVSLTEGYTLTTRPAWTPENTASNSIDNFNAVAKVTIATTSTLTVTGAAMLTNSTRGGTSGKLISASKYAAARTFQDGDEYEIGYRLSFTAA